MSELNNYCNSVTLLCQSFFNNYLIILNVKSGSDFFLHFVKCQSKERQEVSPRCIIL